MQFHHAQVSFHFTAYFAARCPCLRRYIPCYLRASATSTTKMFPLAAPHQASASGGSMESSSSRNPSLNKTREETHILLDTTTAISSMIDKISGLPSMPPSIYIDLEGVNLSRQGTISIMQIHVRPASQNYLVDIKTLGKAAFLTQGTCALITLKSILESPSIPKVFFDVRRDSDALYSHYGIELQGIQDLQLMELATHTHSRKFITGLKKCIEKDMPMTKTEKHNWLMTKEEGLKLFDPEKGGSYEVFNQRPLPEKIRLYCVQDVHYLPCLWDVYNRKLTAQWKTRVQHATEDRVAQSQAQDFDPKSPHMARAPEGW
ncbi:ribonuclease H-like domain-containing protein [Xylaria telfairii]|nr:ribonuclease H-like domain-containing protein [Xylaria telfairii]